MDVRSNEWEGAIGGPRDEALSRNLVEWNLSHPQHFWDNYEAGLREMAAVPRLKSLAYAPLLIERELRRLPTDRIRFGVERMGLAGQLEVAGFSRLAQIRVLVGVIVGEFVSSLREDDAASLAKDAKSHRPRMFSLGWSAPSDPVLGPVAMIEREFNERTAIGLRLESMVTMLVHTIETVVKSVWPTEFAEQGRRSNFGRLLDEKATRSIDEHERQFARHAQHLYKQYRNRAIHDPQNFHVSYFEVVYFISGIRVLYELAQKIRRAHQADGK